MKRKRIAFVTYSLGIGGVAKVLTNLLNSIDYSKFEVDLFVADEAPGFDESLPCQVSIHYIGSFISFWPRIKNDIIHFRVGDCFYILFWRFLRIFHSFGSDKWEYLCGKMLSNYRSKTNYDVIISFHGCIDLMHRFVRFSLVGERKILWVHGNIGANHNHQLLNSFDQIVCVSKDTEKWFLSEYPENVGKTQVLYNVIDVNEIIVKANETADDMQTKGISIVSVGRMTEEKGFQMIPQIARKLMDEGYLFDWYLVGNGPLSCSIQQECDYKHVPCVHLLGAKMNPYPYMKNCTLYVQPSYTEGFCTTTNEAKVLCKPIIVTDVPGMREQFEHDVNGYIVPSATVDEIYKAVKYMLDHEEVRNRYVQYLQEHPMDQQENVRAIQDFLMQ